MNLQDIHREMMEFGERIMATPEISPEQAFSTASHLCHQADAGNLDAQYALWKIAGYAATSPYASLTRKAIVVAEQQFRKERE